MFMGLPACGKSTQAKKIVAEGNHWVRLNRDDLRATLFPGCAWSGKRESIVVDAEKSVTRNALKSGFNVVIDDTNLSPKNLAMWTQVAAECGAKFELADLTSVPIDECIFRDRERNPGRVGRAVIERMALFNNLLPPLKKDGGIAIFDIDGTLANGEHRYPLVNNGNHDWGRYKSLSMKDTVYPDIANWFRGVRPNMNVFLVSGRGTDEGADTEEWLEWHDLIPDRMFMRQGGDFRQDAIIKQEILDKMIAAYGKDAIKFAVDDRPQVIEMWKKNGIQVFPVHQERWMEKGDVA